MAKRKQSHSREDALAMIWAAYRASLPLVLIFAGAMLLVTWLIVTLLF